MTWHLSCVHPSLWGFPLPRVKCIYIHRILNQNPSNPDFSGLIYRVEFLIERLKASVYHIQVGVSGVWIASQIFQIPRHLLCHDTLAAAEHHYIIGLAFPPFTHLYSLPFSPSAKWVIQWRAGLPSIGSYRSFTLTTTICC